LIFNLTAEIFTAFHNPARVLKTVQPYSTYLGVEFLSIRVIGFYP